LFRICFIDDDEKFEIRLFRDVFGEAFDIVAATDYFELKSQLDGRKGWMPDLFVLDLYFPCEPVNQDEIEALRAEPLSLENDNAEIRTAYRNYLGAKARLANILEVWNQNANGGLKLAEKVAADYPKIPIVFYSRKATLEDAVRCLAAKNVWWVEKKPTGKDPAETIELTKSAKQRIAHRFETVISKTGSENVKRLKEAAKVLVENLQEFS
jgi:CheY-like chemotaxis protein